MTLLHSVFLCGQEAESHEKMNIAEWLWKPPKTHDQCLRTINGTSAEITLNSKEFAMKRIGDSLYMPISFSDEFQSSHSMPPSFAS